MKRILYAIVSGMLFLAPMSCKKDDPAPAASTLPSAPEALAEHNTKSGGIYKGTFANSTASGNVKVVLQGGVKTITVVLNGVSRTLNTTGLETWSSGQELLGTAFSSADWTATFYAAADGSVYDLSLSLAGETGFSTVIAKETSTTQVRVYEGTYAGAASGKWNFTTLGGLIGGIYTDDSGGSSFSGGVLVNNITISSGDVNATGTFASDLSTCSGTWESSSTSGTWSGTRKL